jgi:DnaJ-domain-containing protein 1
MRMGKSRIKNLKNPAEMIDLPPSKRQVQARTEVLNVALRMWRDPQADPLAVLHIGDYADDMRLLLHVASNDADYLAEAMMLTGASAQDLIAAAVHYIEYRCLQVSASPYRILGVQADASADTVRKHYRMLIKLFHPDRALVPQARAEACSAAINQAYAQLRNGQEAKLTEPLSAMQFSRQESATPSMPVRSEPLRSEPQAAHVSSAGQQALPFLRQVPIQVLFWGAAMIALLLFLSLNFRAAPMQLTAIAPSVPAVQTAEPSPELAAPAENNLLTEAPQEAVLAAPAVMPEPLPVSEDVRVSMPAVTLPPAAAKTTVPIKSSSAQLNQTSTPASDTSHTLAQSIGTPTGTPVIPAIKSSIAPSQPKPETLAAVSAAEVGAALNPSADISELHLRDLIIQFVDSYNQGDIERFSGLMQPQLRGTEGHSQAEVRESYGKLFAKSEQREIVLKDLHWDIHGPTAVGLMDYKISIRGNGSRNTSTALGTLKLEVRLVNQTARISGMVNTPGKH